MNTRRIHNRTEHYIVIAVDGATEPITTWDGKQFLPERVSLAWGFQPRRGWELKIASAVGKTLTKGGQLGSRTSYRDFATLIDGLQPGTPDWLVDLVREYEPSGVVLLP